ncbi:MAG: hypothetical protein ACYC7D_05635 [Nitrososphaerales archaeon]
MSAADGGVLTGTVSFSGSAGGQFTVASCNADSAGLHCEVHFSATSNSAQTITAQYSGDQYHASSSGSSIINTGGTGHGNMMSLALAFYQLSSQASEALLLALFGVGAGATSLLVIRTVSRHIRV